MWSDAIFAEDKITANSEWYSRFGFNITRSLVNPFEPGGSETITRNEIAAILYDVRMSGGSVVRWIVTDVASQWRCGLDPEDIDTSELDPGWLAVTRILLEEAARQNVVVVIALMNLANGGFGAVSSEPKDMLSHAHLWADHRLNSTGSDGYKNHTCAIRAGYHGATRQAEYFVNPSLRFALANRFSAMVGYLASFPAIGAVELFNEPDYSVTQTDAFWSTVGELRQRLRSDGGRSATLPVYSGVAWWSSTIADAASRSGQLREEPVLMTHSYEDYTSTLDARLRGLHKLVSDMRDLLPNRPIVVAEFASSVSLSSSAQHQVMIDSAYGSFGRDEVAIWVWGNYFPPAERDFKWDFNHRSPMGDAFRQYFFSEHEQVYATPRALKVVRFSSDAPQQLLVKILRDRDRGWIIDANNTRFMGMSEAGVFPKVQARIGTKVLYTAAQTFFLADKSNAWIAMRPHGLGWSMTVYVCDSVAATGTPYELLGLAAEVHWASSDHCQRSRAMYGAEM